MTGIFRRIGNSIKNFWNWLRGKTPSASASSPSQPDPIATEAGLPKHFVQTTAAGGTPEQYIVNSCAINSMKTAMAFALPENDPRIINLVDNLETFLRQIERTGLKDEQLQQMEENMKAGAHFDLYNYQGCYTWDALINNLQHKNINPLYLKSTGNPLHLKSNGDISHYGIMAFLAQEGFKTELCCFMPQAANKNHQDYLNQYSERYLTVLKALKDGKPVLVGDDIWTHAYLLVRRNNTLYWSNPLSSNWQTVEKNSLKNGFQIFDQNYDAFAQATPAERERMVSAYPKGFMMIIDQFPPKPAT